MIYMVNVKTKEHCRLSDDLVSHPDWMARKADPDGWIPHDGGECPLPDGHRYEVKNRDGEWGEGVIGKWVHGSWKDSFDIIAYRPILDDKEEDMSWNGEGLPPVGVECEAKDDYSQWQRCRIAGVEGSQLWIDFHDDGYATRHIDDIEIRPIRSAEDKAVEALVKEFVIPGGAGDLAERAYHAIRDGKIPGILLDAE